MPRGTARAPDDQGSTSEADSCDRGTMSGVDRHSADRSVRSGIDDGATGLNDSTVRKSGRLQTTRSHYVKNSFPAGDQIIGDDAAVASPPHGLRTHYRTTPFASFIEQMLEAGVKMPRKRIIGVVMEALIRPEAVDIRR